MLTAAFYFFLSLVSFKVSGLIYDYKKINKGVRVALAFLIAVLGIYLFYYAGFSVVEYRANR